jgi:hypothetical protein
MNASAAREPGAVVAPDYYAIGSGIAVTIERGSKALTAAQRTCLVGAVAIYLDRAYQREEAMRARAEAAEDKLSAAGDIMRRAWIVLDNNEPNDPITHELAAGVAAIAEQERGG